MTLKQQSEPKNIGACLNDAAFPTRGLWAHAGRLTQIQSALHEWAGEPLAHSLSVANERDGLLIVYAESAAALTQVRYRQQELIQFLLQRVNLRAIKLEVKIRPSA